jgi:hypothetical protein
VRDVVVRAGGRRAVAINAFTVSALPGGESTTLVAIKDAVVRAARYRNEGANPTLRLSGRTSRVLIGFDAPSIPRENVRKARLVLTMLEGTRPHGVGLGRQVGVYPVLTEWVEGNGKSADLLASERTRGSGPGTTWSCPVDPDIADHRPGCDVFWKGAQPSGNATDSIDLTSRTDGAMEWDVTADVQRGVSTWVLDLLGTGRVRYYAREGTTSNAVAPHLIVEHE